MSSFLYYLPKHRVAPPLVQLHAASLGHAFDRSPGHRGTQKGPDGDAGVYLGDDTALMRIGTGQERWRKIPGSEAWVGRFLCDEKGLNHKPPGPTDLARKTQLAGHLVKLADGQEWLAPVARGWTEEAGELRWYHALPQRLELDKEGQWSPGAVLSEYTHLWDLANRWNDTLAAAYTEEDEPSEADEDEPGEKQIEFQELVTGAITALAVNYRIGLAEAELLGLFTFELCTSKEARAVLNALIDLPTWAEWAQKKTQAEAAGSNSADGEKGLTAAIDPQ